MSFNEHFTRIKEGANNVYNLHNLSAFIEKHINLGGKPYCFGDKYGFQATIVNDTARVTNTSKPAQIGLTTTTMAYVLAGVCTQPKFNCIYALPSASDAQKLVATKLNPLIDDSPEVLRLVDYDLNNNELKKIGKNFLFIRGTKSETAALSISADALVADEIDRCDPATLKQFRSRLQASELQIVKQFSTPTIKGVGIDREAKTSKRYRHMAKCDCCGNVWLPSYHTDIVIPDFSNDLKELNSENIKDVKWQQARWNCPSCHRDPKLHPNNLQWVCENPIDNYEANTYYVSPVTACLVLLPAYLVRTSTEFESRSEWQNQVLGETAENSQEQITEEDVNRAIVDTNLTSSELHVIGADMGLTCAVTVARELADGTLLAVHREMVPIGLFKDRLQELKIKYKVAASAYDVFPYTNLIMEITEADPNAYGVGPASPKATDMYTLKEKEANAEEAKLNLRRLLVHRTMWLDKIMELFKTGKIVIQKQDLNYNSHYISVKRTQVMQGDELAYVWQKTDGADHMLFSIGYAYLASKMRSRASWTHPEAVPLVSSFRMKNR